MPSRPVTLALTSACFIGSIYNSSALALPTQPSHSPTQPPSQPLNWKSVESPSLTSHTQLTFREKFIKAGEAYFSHDDRWIIFQATAVPSNAVEADPFYAMYIAKVRRDPASGDISGLDEPLLVSVPGSANTCGWFDPTRPGVVIFGSTLGRPSDEQKSGFQVGSRRYVWMFPAEMEIVERAVVPMLEIPLTQSSNQHATTISQAIDALRTNLDARSKSAPSKPFADALTGGNNPGKIANEINSNLDEVEIASLREMAAIETTPKAIFTRSNYDAESSYSNDGRFILYAHIEDSAEPAAKPDANIYIYDTQTKKHHPIVVAPGYDGGPFFSPDNKRICYRSDRKGNDLLQLFIADLKFEDGIPTGITREYQVTDNQSVNWAPFFHPSGDFLVYGSSQAGHHNYEIFAVKLDPAILAAAAAASTDTSINVKGLEPIRITQADGADVLPVFTKDGSYMMWTSQRGPKIEKEERPSSQLWIAKWNGLPTGPSTGQLANPPVNPDSKKTPQAAQ